MIVRGRNLIVTMTKKNKIKRILTDVNYIYTQKIFKLRKYGEF